MHYDRRLAGGGGRCGMPAGQRGGGGRCSMTARGGVVRECIGGCEERGFYMKSPWIGQLGAVTGVPYL